MRTFAHDFNLCFKTTQKKSYWLDFPNGDPTFFQFLWDGILAFGNAAPHARAREIFSFTGQQ